MEKATHSYTFTLTGKEAELVCYFNPPIYLSDNSEYEMALLNFETFNSIPNVDESNNLLHYETDKGILETVEIPVGIYDIDDIEKAIESTLTKASKTEIVIKVSGNNNTQRVNVKANVKLNLSKDKSIGSLLGFDKKILEANMLHTSDFIANINKVNVIQVYCNLTSGSYINGEPVHVLYQFFPKVPAGFKIIESPQEPIYLPVSMKVISLLIVRLLDQSGEPVNFQHEEITVTFHLRKLT